MRNRDSEIRRLVQMSFSYQMPQHMSLVLKKLSLPDQKQRMLLVDGPDRRVSVLD